MDPLPRRRWEDLPADLLADIARRLRCLADRVHMSMVCTSWAKGERIHPRPRQLPWLLLPYPSARRLPPNIARTAAFLCFPDHSIHHLRVGEDTRGARFFGSYDGGWLFLAHNQTSGHALVNIHTNRRIRLPDCISWEIDGGLTTKPMVILAATLSSPPVPTGQCVVAAIVTTLDAPTLTVSPRQIAIWRLEIDQVAIGWSWYDAPCCLQDVIYYNGAFRVLTDMGNILVIIPDFQEQAGLVVHSMLRHFLMVPYLLDLDGVQMTARYLVESRGKLLMVERWSRNTGLQSSGFNLFEIWHLALPNGEFRYYWVWTSRSDSLLFVARGCSRSYEKADFPGSAGNIYFLDDRSSYDVSTMIRPMHWDRRYTCNDNGRYRASPPSRIFDGAKPSNYSSPIWFLP